MKKVYVRINSALSHNCYLNSLFLVSSYINLSVIINPNARVTANLLKNGTLRVEKRGHCQFKCKSSPSPSELCTGFLKERVRTLLQQLLRVTYVTAADSIA